MQSRTRLHMSGAELRGDLAPSRRRERAAVLATEVHDEEIVNVPGMHEDEMYLEVVPMTSPLRACTRAALSSEANSRLCGVESEQPCSPKWSMMKRKSTYPKCTKEKRSMWHLRAFPSEPMQR